MIEINVFWFTVVLVLTLLFGFWLGLNQGIINVKEYGVDEACEMIFEPIVICEK